MTMIYFYKEISCSCGHEIIAVGNILGEPMTAGPDNVIVRDVEVGKLTTTEGPKEDIRFKLDCPNCGIEIQSEVVSELVE